LGLDVCIIKQQIETWGLSAPTHNDEQAQPMTSVPTIPQRITRSIAQTLGVEYQLISLFVIFVE